MKPCQTSSKESTQERERKRNQGQGPKFRQADSPNYGCHREVKETTKDQNLLQLHEAYQLNKGEVKAP